VALSKVGSSPGGTGTYNFTVDSGLFAAGDILIYGVADNLPSLSISGLLPINTHVVTSGEAGATTVAVAAGTEHHAPGVALRGGTVVGSVHHTGGAASANGDGVHDRRGNGTVSTGSSTSPVSITINAASDGTGPASGYEAVVYAFIGADQGIGAGAAWTTGALSDGLTLGSFGDGVYGIGASYKLAATPSSAETAVQASTSWTGGGGTRGWGKRGIIQIHLDVNTIAANIVLAGGTPTLDITADTTGSGSGNDGFGEAATVDINWGDGGAHSTGLYTTVSWAHTYADRGTYTVTVTVTDSLFTSRVATDSADIVVGAPTDSPPPNFEPASRHVHIRELPHQVSSPMFDDL
jgi:hypothetical protein